MAAVIKLNPEGKVILRNGKPSCTCCCDFEVLEIGVDLIAGPGDTGYFTIKNNGASEITVTGYTGYGIPGYGEEDFPKVIGAGLSVHFFVFNESGGGEGAFFGQPFTLTDAVCGVSPTYYYPSGYTGYPSWG